MIHHQFVDAIPAELAENTLYISIPYATAAHKCMCGCGHEVVTPLTPTDWSLTFDGESVSLRPSVGNWSFDCQSHYWIIRSTVRWGMTWTEDEIEQGRARDRVRKEQALGGEQREQPRPIEPLSHRYRNGARRLMGAIRERLLRLLRRP